MTYWEVLVVVAASCYLGCQEEETGGVGATSGLPDAGVDGGADSGQDGGSGPDGGTGGFGTPCEEPTGDSNVVQDTEFDDAGWTLTESSTPGADVSTDPTGQSLSGGAGEDPSAYRSMTHTIENPAEGADENCTSESCAYTLVVTHEYQSTPYTPQGTELYIDYSESHIITAPAFAGAAVGWSFAIWQDGSRFTYVQEQGASAFTDLTWTTEYRCGLVAADFAPAPGPDFSAGAPDMTFGFTRSNTNTTPDTLQRNEHGIDDFRVTIVRDPL
ncbi:MAG: hypothetical protein WBG86_17300 [Polyangiales bacterium]